MVRPHTKKYRTSTGDDQEEEEQDAYEMEEEYDEWNFPYFFSITIIN